MFFYERISKKLLIIIISNTLALEIVAFHETTNKKLLI
jgi:hypothetical protein